jgi:ubiquinone/menaquinone biosynthesis C-methylase UbiE
MNKRVDYDSAASAYRRTRTLAHSVLDVWRAALAPYFEGPAHVIDIGAGTGQFSARLADWFRVQVVALEPSRGMQNAASGDDHLRFVAGRGEALPFAAQSFDRAWLSAVVHHFTDLDGAMREVRRVLAPSGLVLVRGFFRDVDPPSLFALFRGLNRSAAAFRSTAAVLEILAAHSFRLVAVSDVVEVHDVASPWEERLRQLRTADSLLRPLTDNEFETGIASLRGHLRTDAVLEQRVTLRLLVANAA